MALTPIESGQGVAVSYTYTVDNELDYGGVPINVSFLNTNNNYIYHKDSSGKIAVVGKKDNLTSNYHFTQIDENSVAYSIALGGI